MAEKNKIDRYGLGARVVELYREGKTTVEIAEYLTEGFLASGIEDSIDQSTVSRWLKKIKDADMDARLAAEQATQEVIRRRVEAGVSGDVDQIEWVQEFFYQIARNELGDQKFSIKERAWAGMNLVKLIDTKLRLPGVLTEEEDENDTDAPAIPSRSNVHSILGRINRAVQS